jgi:hypothetical protein
MVACKELVCVPDDSLQHGMPTLRNKFMSEVHEGFTAMHLGSNIPEYETRRHAYWPRIRKVQLFVSALLVRGISPCSGSRRWWHPMACTIHNSKFFHKGGRVVVKPVLVHARRAPRILPPTSRLNRPSVPQSTCNLNARTKRYYSLSRSSA